VSAQHYIGVFDVAYRVTVERVTIGLRNAAWPMHAQIVLREYVETGVLPDGWSVRRHPEDAGRRLVDWVPGAEPAYPQYPIGAGGVDQ
jgi:hypothetical protein